MMDGNIAYQGYACQAASYFEKLGAPCPTYQNPSDFYMKRLAVRYPPPPEDIAMVDFFSSEYKNVLEPDVI